MSSFDLGEKAEAFRTWLREWIEANAPADRKARRKLARDPAWADALRGAGLLCVSWPKDYGGGGLGPLEMVVLNEEFAAAGVPKVTRGMGEGLVGPSIIVHGTDEQKARFLPRIIDGTDRYCQGFSEPDAGSDLASLKTRGVIDGDEIVITGQKVWTSWYWDATMLFCLCRTNTEAEKHEGISYVLVPIKQADGSPNGVEFRPLKQLTGESHFAETFLTEARAPLANVIGGLNRGWHVSRTTLGNERGGSATTQYLQHAADFERLRKTVAARGLGDDPVVRQHMAWAYSHVQIMRFSGLRTLAAMVDERDPGPAASINKMFWSEYQQRLGELAVGMLGAEGMLADSSWHRLFFGSRSHTIWGGTAEIQRNIVAERVLGLPRDPEKKDSVEQ
ncbi:MAG TPA: acyl-CoA dehydrogenase family protein [Acidimicrobiales bacterium]|nr:acyl-CoA dehydrogenase family protein [Acidimicrobiales bacterium]